jgi:hypothetical protein
MGWDPYNENARRINERYLVSADGLEPSTHALKGLAARKISDLH